MREWQLSMGLGGRAGHGMGRIVGMVRIGRIGVAVRRVWNPSMCAIRRVARRRPCVVGTRVRISWRSPMMMRCNLLVC